MCARGLAKASAIFQFAVVSTKSTLAQTISSVGCFKISRGAFRNLNLAHEPVSDRGHGFDETRLVAVVAQQPPQQPDAACKGTLGNGGIAPYGIQQFFLRDQLLWAAQQEQEDAKRLRLDRQHLALLEERELVLANLNVGEAENKGLILHHRFHNPT